MVGNISRSLLKRRFRVIHFSLAAALSVIDDFPDSRSSDITANERRKELGQGITYLFINPLIVAVQDG